MLRCLQQMKESLRSKVATSLSVARMIFGPDKAPIIERKVSENGVTNSSGRDL